MANKGNDHNSEGSRYQDRYVAFVDILGFASIVDARKSDSAQVERLNQALSRLSAKGAVEGAVAFPMEATNFSDTVVLSTTISSDGLLLIFDAISRFTVDLLNMNMLLRGAVVRGALLHSADVTFGPALVHAYRLESKTSFHPRVMIDQPVMADIEVYSAEPKHRAQFEKFVVTDSHDIPYLSPFAAWHDHPELDQENVERLIMLQTIIATGLIQTARTPAICEKYKWLARKFNSFVLRRGLENKVSPIGVD